MRKHGLALWLLLCVTACVEADPLYCERDTSCPANMRCLLPQRECALRPEVCANGVDDNGDTRVDCDDPLCAADPLCQALPQGAYGVLATSTNAAPSCNAGSTAVGSPIYTGITGQNTCTGCKCTLDCGLSLQVYQTADDCKALLMPLETVALTGACQDLSARAGVLSYVVQGGTMASCKQDPTVKVAPAYSATQGRLCQVNTLPTNCTTPACVLVAYARYNPCVVLEGDVACPTGFTSRQRWYRGVNDTRTCTCCTTPPNRTCNASTSLYRKAACGDASNSVSGCTQASGVLAVNYSLLNSPSCNANPSISGGSIEPTGPATLCCR